MHIRLVHEVVYPDKQNVCVKSGFIQASLSKI